MNGTRKRAGMARRLVAMTSALALSLGLAACSGADPEARTSEPTSEPTASSSPTAKEPRQLTFGVFGHAAEIKAYGQVVSSFNASSQTRQVELVTYDNAEDARAAVLGDQAPDVFLSPRRDLMTLAENSASRPVSLLLDERGVDFGDRYSRDALDAFAYDDELQCMPYSVSPMVMYFNSDLIDFERMERRGLDVPSVNEDGIRSDRWTLAEFAAAAQFATRRRSQVDGVWIEPSLRGLAPFIYSGGGQVFDDETAPTSLDFSDDNTRSALEQTLAILRDTTLTPSADKLAQASAVQLFKRGQLAMIAGFRDLVPELRAVDGLSFDTISMPVIEDQTTVGDIDGLCISAHSENVNDAADFLAYAVSDAALEIVTHTGYIVPANTEVAGSEAFLTPGQEPEHATVFNSAIRGMIIPPLITNGPELEAAVAPQLDQLVTSPGALDLELVTEEIDNASRAVLDPESLTESPTEDPSEDSSQ